MGWISFLSPNHQRQSGSGTVIQQAGCPLCHPSVSKQWKILSTWTTFPNGKTLSTTEILLLLEQNFWKHVVHISWTWYPPSHQTNSFKFKTQTKLRALILVAWFHPFSRKSTASFYAGSLITNTLNSSSNRISVTDTIATGV